MLTLLQYVQKCIHIAKGYFFVQMKQDKSFYWLTHKAEKCSQQHWSVATAPVWLLFTEQESGIRFSLSSVLVHAGV